MAQFRDNNEAVWRVAQYRDVGLCIYCGNSEGLTREHAIPFALNGDLVLPAASCKKCSEITSAFETKVLKGPIWQVRVGEKFKSRKKHRDAPTTVVVKALYGSVWKKRKLPF